jgi:hypothetical protein
MLRPLMISTVIGIGALLTINSAEAASTYCARYVGGKERTTSAAHAHCDFASLKACRASLRERGGGHCYKAAKMR